MNPLRPPLGTVGLLHPGAMGSTIGAALVATGHRVLWAGAGRSAATRARADAAGLDQVANLESLVDGSDTILSICPPDAAVDVARSVTRARFGGRYVDANAIAPSTVAIIAGIVATTGATLVDGGLIGPPAHRAGTTRLALSGRAAPLVADGFRGSNVEVILVGDEPGAASALKLCYAAWTKGSAALLLTIRAAAAEAGVEAALLDEWARSQPGLADRSGATASGSAPKAWRWVGEMHEIATFLETSGLPGGWFDAAGEIYRRLESSKDRTEPPVSIGDVIDQLNRARSSSPDASGTSAPPRPEP